MRVKESGLSANNVQSNYCMKIQVKLVISVGNYTDNV